MKAELSVIDGFHTLVELTEVAKPEGYHALSFTTVFERSRHPEGEREVFRLLLDDQALAKLREVLK